MKTSFLKVDQKASPLMDAMVLKNGNKKKKGMGSNLAIALPLTSLIDAFSIIVIYLLIGTQNSGIETSIPSRMNLPQASHSQGIDKETAILRIEKGSYFLNDKAVSGSQLSDKLAELKKTKDDKVELMIQADTEMKYADLDPLLKAGSQAGIEKLKFAVVPK